MRKYITEEDQPQLTANYVYEVSVDGEARFVIGDLNESSVFYFDEERGNLYEVEYAWDLDPSDPNYGKPYVTLPEFA